MEPLSGLSREYQTSNRIACKPTIVSSCSGPNAKGQAHHNSGPQTPHLDASWPLHGTPLNTLEARPEGPRTVTRPLYSELRGQLSHRLSSPNTIITTKISLCSTSVLFRILINCFPSVGMWIIGAVTPTKSTYAATSLSTAG